MKRFILRSFLFSLPFLALVFLDVFVLPIDFFTFRVWEALKVDALKNMLPGYFYPGMRVAKTEEGDLAHHTAFAVKKRVKWHTDRFGYRNRDEVRAPEVVIIGDSNTVGAGLTQKDVLSEVLGRSLGVEAYSFAPASVNTFLRERRFLNNHPRVVVVATIEWDLPLLRSLKPELASPPYWERRFIDFRCAVKESPMIQRLAVPLDRVFKANMLHYCRASIRRAVAAIPSRKTADGAADQLHPRIHFILGDLANKDITDEQFARTVRVVTSYHDLFRTMGIRFIFLPIPNKENIYYDLLPSGKKPVFLRQLIDALREKGVETIDAQGPYEEIYRTKGTILYQPDDSHWSAEGVKIAAGLLADAISPGARKAHGPGPR